MSQLLRRWMNRLGGPRDAAAEAMDGIDRWASAQRHRFAIARGGEGFVIEPQGSSAPDWRIEWGPPQRRYIEGYELRIRIDLGARADLQMLVADAELMKRLEEQVFEQAVEATQTRVDDSTPEEMRWLVLYKKLPRTELGALRERFGALSNPSRAALSWLDGDLVAALAASDAWRPKAAPLALIVQRSRFVLRTLMPEPSAKALAAALALAQAAAAAARRVGEDAARGSLASQLPDD